MRNSSRRSCADVVVVVAVAIVVVVVVCACARCSAYGATVNFYSAAVFFIIPKVVHGKEERNSAILTRSDLSEYMGGTQGQRERESERHGETEKERSIEGEK